MAQRSFVVRVSGDTPRVVVEDVRTREKVVADSLEAVGEQIERWLQDGVAPGEAIAADQEEGVDA